MVVTWRETKVLLTSLAKRKATAQRLPRVNVAFIAILVSPRGRFNFPGDRGIPVEKRLPGGYKFRMRARVSQKMRRRPA